MRHLCSTWSLSRVDQIFDVLSGRSVAFLYYADGLKRYFSQFGKVTHCTIMRDAATNRSRGFAFLTFEDPKAVNTVMVREHFLDGKIVSK